MASLALDGAKIYTPTRCIEAHSLLIENGYIQAIEASHTARESNGVNRIDASGLTIVPGFIDLQINGAFGYDFTADPSSIWQVCEGLTRYGVTSFLPTIITSPLETISRAQEVMRRGSLPTRHGARPLGLHVEGPYLNPDRKGAHNPIHLRPPNTEEFKDLSPKNNVLLVTLAPELPGSSEVISALIKRGVIVSAGHSLASYEQAIQAFNQGVRYGTHIFNAMPAYNHFEPGLVGALLDDHRPYVGLIADGIHVHPAVVNMIWKSVNAERLTLVTDAMAALGMPPGRYVIADMPVNVDEVSARLESGNLAGSILSMDTALRNLIKMTSCDLSEALRTVTLNPAKLLGLSDEIGQIAVGQRADLTLLTQELEIAMTICGGEISYDLGNLSDMA